MGPNTKFEYLGEDCFLVKKGDTLSFEYELIDLGKIIVRNDRTNGTLCIYHMDESVEWDFLRGRPPRGTGDRKEEAVRGKTRQTE